MQTLLTVDEAAARLSITPRHLRELIYRGDIGRVKIGGSVRIRADELARYVEARTIPAA
jgi:excisionase family DNA binding protein